MFQKMMASLVGRVITLTVLGSAISIIAMVLTVMWIFEETLETQLENHLVSYTDLVASTLKTEGQTVTINNSGKLLQSIPRHWQIDTAQKHLAKSDISENWLPIPEKISLHPKRLTYRTAGGNDVVAVQQGFLFPNKVTVIITFGLDKEVAQSYKSQLYNQFRENVYLAMILLGCLISGMGAAIIMVVYIPLMRVSNSLKAVQNGDAPEVSGKFPTEIANLSSQVNQLLAYTSKVIERHRAFSGNLAHALKTPLTAIRNETQSGTAKDRIDTMLQILERNLARAHSAGSANLLSLNTSVKPLLERISDSFGRVYSKNIQINCDPDMLFKCDEADLYEIMGNLIENACKYTRNKIEITAQGNTITVEDDGPGIPPSEMETVFARGVSLDQSKPGSGIGLSITKDIIELYGGELVLSVSEFGGLKVQVRIGTRPNPDRKF